MENVQRNVQRKSSTSPDDSRTKISLIQYLRARKRDLLLGTALLVTALCLFLVFHFIPHSQGGAVQVKSQGKVIAVYSLDDNRTEVITTLFGGENTLVIQEGKAYVTHANCKDALCERMGTISRVGEEIVCLPNELFITVISGEEGDVDAIVQ